VVSRHPNVMAFMRRRSHRMEQNEGESAKAVTAEGEQDEESVDDS